MSALAELLHLAAVLASIPVGLVAAYIFYRGGLDLYRAYRFSRSGYVDPSAGIRNYDDLVWLIGSQPQRVAEAMPWVRQDLSEQRGLRPDDGEMD